jgi:predicted dehydrogenase
MDLIQHWFGPIDRVSALVRTHETRALARDGSEIPVSSDDTCFATVTCESGVDVQLTLTMAGHGQPIGQRLLIGSRGSVTSTCWEAWEAGMVSWDSGEQASTDDAVGRWIGQLDPQARSTLLAEGTWDPDNISVDVSDPLRYGVAAEVLDFILAIQDRRSPEVGAPEAIHALAAALAILESSALGRTVTVASVIDGSVSTWQDSLKALHRG